MTFSREGLSIFEPRGTLILDFGLEYSGSLRILSHEQKDGFGKIRIRLGESLGEVMGEIGEDGRSNDHTIRDFPVDIPSFSDQVFGPSGFRYVRIDNLLDQDYAIVLSYSHINLPIQGYFRSSDLVLNKIFDVAVRTAYLCLQNGYIYDGIKRDRLVWGGDLGSEIESLLPTVMPSESIKRSLRLLREAYPLPSWINDIPSYSLHYLKSLYQYVIHTCDQAFFEENKAYINGILDQLAECLTSNGDFDPMILGCTYKPLAYFIDWPSKGHISSRNVLSSLLVSTLRAF